MPTGGDHGPSAPGPARTFEPATGAPRGSAPAPPGTALGARSPAASLGVFLLSPPKSASQ